MGGFSLEEQLAKLTIVGERNKGFSEMSLVELFVCLFFHLLLEQKLERITDKATICMQYSY